MIHLWAPNIFEFKGGIQLYSRMLLETLGAILPNEKISTHLKHDTIVHEDYRDIHCYGAVPKIFRSVTYGGCLIGAVLKERPRLIISTHLNFGPVAYVANKILGIPYWLVAHGVEAWDIKSEARRRAIRSATRVLSVSEFTEQHLLNQKYITQEQSRILPNTLQEERFSIAPRSQALMRRYGIQENDKVLLTVCRLDAAEAYKGYDRIIELMPQLCKRFPSLKYVLVGKGSDEDRVRQLVKKQGVQSSVILTGFVSDEELPAHYNLCDLFVMPSLGEGFGIVYLEALGSGKPCIGSSQDGATFALDNGKMGTLVNPNDKAELFDAIVRELENNLRDPHILREMVIKRFGKTAFQRNLQALLKEGEFL